MSQESVVLNLEEIYKYAKAPDLPAYFFILSAIWLVFNLIVGILTNGAVLIAFIKHQAVGLKKERKLKLDKFHFLADSNSFQLSAFKFGHCGFPHGTDGTAP